MKQGEKDRRIKAAEKRLERFHDNQARAKKKVETLQDEIDYESRLLTSLMAIPTEDGPHVEPTSANKLVSDE